MKKLLVLAFSSLILLGSTSMRNPQTTCKDYTLLVLKNPMDENLFSTFKVTEVGNVLVGRNREEYLVNDGIYQIEATSNDKYYHKRILIVSY